MLIIHLCLFPRACHSLLYFLCYFALLFFSFWTHVINIIRTILQYLHTELSALRKVFSLTVYDIFGGGVSRVFLRRGRSGHGSWRSPYFMREEKQRLANHSIIELMKKERIKKKERVEDTTRPECNVIIGEKQLWLMTVWPRTE